MIEVKPDSHRRSRLDELLVGWSIVSGATLVAVALVAHDIVTWRYAFGVGA